MALDLTEEATLLSAMATAAAASAAATSQTLATVNSLLSLLDSSSDDEYMSSDEFFDDVGLRAIDYSDEMPQTQIRGENMKRHYQEGHNILVRQYFADFPDYCERALYTPSRNTKGYAKSISNDGSKMSYRT